DMHNHAWHFSLATTGCRCKSQPSSPNGNFSNSRGTPPMRMVKSKTSDPTIVAIAAALVAIAVYSSRAFAASASEIDRNISNALITLYKTTPGARALADRSKGMLVFPNIVKGGFIVAGQYGDGALREHGRTIGYYRSIEASVGFQAGAQSFGYVLFFMDDAS